MAKRFLILGALCVGKGAALEYIGKDTDVPTITKDDAKGYGIKAAEFDKLVSRGTLVEVGEGSEVVVESDEPKPLSAKDYIGFVGAVGKLEEGNTEHWTNDNKPDVSALKEHGCIVTAAERDEAWAIYNAQ